MRRSGNIVLNGEDRYVYLVEDDIVVGMILVNNKTTRYTDDLIENWETGVLKKDNPHIIKELFDE